MASEGVNARLVEGLVCVLWCLASEWQWRSHSPPCVCSKGVKRAYDALGYNDPLECRTNPHLFGRTPLGASLTATLPTPSLLGKTPAGRIPLAQVLDKAECRDCLLEVGVAA